MTLTGSTKTLDIKDIETSSQDDYRAALSEIGVLGLEMYPLSIGKKRYWVDKAAII